MSPRLVVDNTRPRAPRGFVDGDDVPILGTAAPQPCPFCGSGADEIIALQVDKNGARVVCLRCNCYGPERLTQVEAAHAWNGRPSGVTL
jgi:hypothetical protein